jgi:hypothetical protein
MTDMTDQLASALQELVTLKELKDSFGKTGSYLERQPLAWEAARAALDALDEDPWLPEGEVPETPGIAEDPVMHWQWNTHTPWNKPEPVWIGPSNKPTAGGFRWSRHPLPKMAAPTENWCDCTFHTYGEPHRRVAIKDCTVCGGTGHPLEKETP